MSSQKCSNQYLIQTLLNELFNFSYTIWEQSHCKHCKKNTLICIWIINTIHPCKHKMQYFPAEKMFWTFCRAVACRLLSWLLPHTRLTSTKRFTNLKVNSMFKLATYFYTYLMNMNQRITTFWVLRDSKGPILIQN